MPETPRRPTPSLSDLADWSWQEFERFAVGVLGAYYQQCGLALVPTPYSHDGGKDGEAIYVFGQPSENADPSDLALIVRLWVEVKQLQKGKVDLDRVSGHVVLATNQGVSKLILITNGVFTDRVKRELREYSAHSRLSLAFVEGSTLLSLYSSAQAIETDPTPPKHRSRSAKQRRSEIPVSAPAICSVHYTIDLYADEYALNDASLDLEAGDPLFVIVEVEAGEQPIPPDARMEVESVPELGELRLLWSSFCTPIMPGEHSRAVYVCYPRAGALIGSNAVVVSIVAASGALLSVHATGRVHVKQVSLVPTELVSHDPWVKELHGRLEMWMQHGGIMVLGLRAIGGVGKSHQMRVLRGRWLSAGPHEILLDGGVHSTVENVADRLLRAILHVPSSARDEEVDQALQSLCERGGLHPRAARSLRSGWKRLREDEAGRSALREPGEMLAALLTLASTQRPVVIAVEDAHKLGPSTLQLLLEILRLLRHTGRGNVLFAATSRPFYSHGPAAPAEGVVDPLEALFELLGAGLAELQPPSRGDAIGLLTSSVAGLAADLAGQIIDQVGTTPFALKEVLLLLEGDNRAIRRVDGRSEPFEIQNLEVFRLKLRPGELRHATRDRLVELRRLMGANAKLLDDFLVCGAVLGRTFPTAIALAGAGADALPSLCETLLFRWDVMRTWRRDGQLRGEFAHDLIRAAILDSVEQDGLQRLASRLDDTGLPGLPALTRARVAAHAGDPEKCGRIAEQSARDAESEDRLWDTFQAVLLQICVVDPDRFTRVLLKGDLVNLVALDESLRLIAVQPDAPPRAHHIRSVYNMLFRCMSLLSQIGVGIRHGAAPLLTELAMLAEELDDEIGRARLDYFRGRAEFSSDNFFGAARHHRAAERRLRRVDPSAPDRLTNLHRLFLCERQMGRLPRAYAYLERISTIHGGAPTASERARIITYRGYAELYHDLRQTLALWRQAFSVAASAGLQERMIDYHLGSAYVAVLLDERDAAMRDFIAVETRLQARDLESSRVRLFLNRGALHLAASRVAEARMDLEEALRIALKYGNLRRLWRVDANLATVFEAAGDENRAITYDLRSAAGWMVRTTHEERFGTRAPWLRQRHVLAPLNVALRARAGSDAHAAILERLPVNTRAEIYRLATLVEEGAGDTLPGNLGFHVKVVRGRLRALLTE